jgi:hypothetical protein
VPAAPHAGDRAMPEFVILFLIWIFVLLRWLRGGRGWT